MAEGATGRYSAEAIRRAVREVPDFPRPGVSFKDITPVLGDRELFRAATDAMAAPFERHGVTHVVAIESRGFILGGPVAQRLNAGLIPVRKAGKLPFRTERVTYALEYGTDALEMHVGACNPGAQILIVDDVLATGGTARAAAELAERTGATVVGYTFLIALSFLPGVGSLGGQRVSALISY